MGMPATKEEYRASFEEVADRLLESDDFRAQLLAFLIASDGPTKWAQDAKQTFTQMTLVHAHRVEDRLNEEHFDSDRED